MIRIHAAILVTCSFIGFTGHYIQFGVARLTPWIPAVMGIIIALIHKQFRNKKHWLKFLPVILVLIFGIITTRMCVRFLPQEFQPARKKIIFCMMSISAWVTMVFNALAIFRTNNGQVKR